jgi:hypothetical protein
MLGNCPPPQTCLLARRYLANHQPGGGARRGAIVQSLGALRGEVRERPTASRIYFVLVVRETSQCLALTRASHVHHVFAEPERQLTDGVNVVASHSRFALGH